MSSQNNATPSARTLEVTTLSLEATTSVPPKKPVVKACAIPQCDQPAETGRLHCTEHQPPLFTACPFLGRAKLLTDRGIRVVPVNAREKRCTLSGWPQLATTRPEEIEAW